MIVNICVNNPKGNPMRNRPGKRSMKDDEREDDKMKKVKKPRPSKMDEREGKEKVKRRK